MSTFHQNKHNVTRTDFYLLLPLLFPLILGVLQHLLLPQVEEVGGISVELKRFLVVIPTEADTNKVKQVHK